MCGLVSRGGGKVMKYQGLKRTNYINWHHKLAGKDNYKQKQCFLGQNQLLFIPQDQGRHGLPIPAAAQNNG